MGFRCGIVGLPNVGKSSLFNALTDAGIDAANFPFCTIEPNVGMVEVPDTRLQAIADMVQPEKLVPATMQFVDIAGLVAGASRGEGLGNQFLANVREMQALAHVVRCFEDDNVVHVDGRVDPLSDIETIDTELALADLASVSKALEKAQKQAKTGDKVIRRRVEILEQIAADLNELKPVRQMELDEDAREELSELHLLTAKPVLYVANVSEDELDGNQYSAKVAELAERQGAACVILCAALEAELAQLPADEQQEMLEGMGLSEPGLNRLIRTGYSLLALQTYFTAGPKECRAWTTQQGVTAPQAAGVIHTDFERGFIRAEVIAYEDYIACQGEQGAKDAGKWRLEGKDYRVADGDVIHFRFNV